LLALTRMESPAGPAPPWLEEERKRAADEVAQLRAKVLSSRQNEKDVQRVLAAKHARREEELSQALSQLQALAPAAAAAAAAPANAPAAAAASDVAVKAAVERERELNATHVRTLQKELETRTQEGLAKMVSVQRELEAQRSRVAKMAAEKAAVASEKARLTLLVEQLRTTKDAAAPDSDPSSDGGEATLSFHSSSAEVSIAMDSSAHDAQSQASELRAENQRLKRQLESAQKAILRDRSRRGGERGGGRCAY
jgi:hypothetical protein